MNNIFKRKKKGKPKHICSLLLSAVMVLNTLSFDGTIVFASEEQETESYGTEASEEGSGAKILGTDVEEIIEKETPKEEMPKEEAPKEEASKEETPIEWRAEEKKTQEETTEEIQKENDNSNEMGTEETTEEKQDNVEELIAALPEHVTKDNAEEVREQLEKILALYTELTEEEQEHLDISRCLELQEALERLEGRGSAKAPALIANEVSYLDCDADGKNWGTKTCTAYTEISSDTTAWSDGWYVVRGAVTISSRVTVTGNVCLILTDGCTLEVTKGITVNSGNGLTIYAQSDEGGMGSLKVTAPDNECAGIGGSYVKAGGEITINGGKITANGGAGGAGIGGGEYGAGGKITINGGEVTADGGQYGAGIGGGRSMAGGEITINGGEVVADGGQYGAGIGGGYGGKITGQTWGTITITGGTITATGGEYGAGIGGGWSQAGGTITITGGTITATGKEGGAAIGEGKENDKGTVFISRATVNGQRYYAVSFVVPGMPELKVPAQVILQDGTATDPGIEISGYTILGWFKNESCTEPFDFTTEKITEDLTLYAKWEECTDFIAEVTIDGESTTYTTIGTAWAALSGKTGTMKVLKDVTTTTTLTVSSGMDVTVEMADGAMFTNTSSDCFQVKGGTLTLTGGTVVEEASGKSVVYAASGTLRITGGAYRSTQGNGLWIDKDVKVRLSGGTISASNIALRYGSRTLKEMLDTEGNQCVVFCDDADNPVTDILEMEKSTEGKTYTVKGNTEHDYEWVNKGATQHRQRCSNCGQEGDYGEHTFQNGVCTLCQAPCAIQVTTEGKTIFYESLAEAWAALDGKTGTLKLMQNITTTDTLTVSSGMDVTVEMAEGVILTNTSSDCFQIKGGTLTLTGGTVVGEAVKKSVVYAASGTLRITGGTYRSTHGNGLWIDKAAKVRLSGGSIGASYTALRYEAPHKLKEMLDTKENQCVVFYNNNNVDTFILEKQESLLNKVYTVKQNTAHKYEWKNRGTQHCRYCSGCGKEKDFGEHTFENDVCTVCGTAAVAKVEADGGGTEHYTSIEAAWEAVQGRTATMTILGVWWADNSLEITDEKTDVTVEMKGRMTKVVSTSDLFIVRRGKLTINSGTFSIGRTGIDITGGTVVMNGGKIDILRSGKGIRIQGSGTLNLCGGELEATITDESGIALCVDGGMVRMTGGTLTSAGSNKALKVSGGKSVVSLLEKEYNFYKDGTPLTDKLDESELGSGTYTVKKCTHNFQFVPIQGTTVHEQKCSLCRFVKGEPEPCQYDWSDGSNKAFCAVCNSCLTVSVDETDGLVYDGTEQKPSVTLILDDGSTLTEGYTVTYADNINAGDNTASVTVEGKTFKGTYTQKFSISKAKGILMVPETTVEKTFGDADFSLNCKTNGDGQISYASDNEDVVSVSADGTVQVKSAGKAVITVSLAEGENYTGAAGKDIIITVKKAAPKVTPPVAADRVYNPVRSLADSDLSGGSAEGVDGKSLKGVWSWKSASLIPSVGSSSYEAVFTPEDATNYKTVTVTIPVTVTKARPYIATLPAASAITYGDALDASILSGGTVRYGNGAGGAGSEAGNSELVKGTFAWKKPSAKPAVSDSGKTEYAVVFTPDDAVNYAPVETAVTLNVDKAQNAPDMPGSTMDVSNSFEKVGDVPLPDGWEWQESDQDTALEVGKTVSAVAVYTGADKGSYEKETVTVAITRSDCDHVAGDVLYTGADEMAPTCTKDGLGHKECTKCGSVVESGIVVKALGHDYTGEVTKEPTVDAEGERTYTCSRCGNTYTEAIPKISCDHASGDDILYTGEGEKAPTCTEDGLGHKECTKCGSVVETGIVVKALGHDYTSEVTKEPTVDAEGERTYTCSRCGNTYTEAIPKEIPEGLWISGLTSSVTYTGNAVKPEGIRVYHGGTLLREKAEYTISYKNNMNAGTAQVIVTGKGSYKGKATAEFTIEAVDLSTDTNIAAFAATAAETGKNLKPAVTVTWNGKKLKEKKDYTLSYDTNIKSSSAEGYDVTINGKGNYKGAIVRKFRVAPKGTPLLNSAKVTGLAKSYRYPSGEAQGNADVKPEGLEADLGKLVVKIGKTTLTKDIDYTIRIEKADAVGTGTVILEPTQTGAYAGEKRISFNIVGTDLKKGSITGLEKSYPYTGESVEPEIRVYSGKKGAGIQIPSDAYTVRYSSCINPGKATVTVTGIPEKGYSGSISAAYAIGKYDISVGKTDSSITIKMPENIKYAKGSAKPQPVITHTGNGTVRTLREGVDYTLKYSNNTSASGKNKPILKITGIGNYCGTVTEQYGIAAQDLGSLTITVADKAYNSKKKGSYYYSAPKVYDLDGKQLKEKADYTVHYFDASTGQEIGKNDSVANGAQIRVTVTAAENSSYTGTLSTTYFVRDAKDVRDIAKAKSDKIAPRQYTGSEIRPEVSLYTQTGKTKTYLTEEDYEIIGYYNNVKKGSATVLIRGRNAYSGVKSITFKITAADNKMIWSGVFSIFKS